MSTTFEVPDEKSVSGLLSFIFGDDLKVDAAADTDFSGQHVATFIDDQDKLVALCLCDKEFVAYSGAALSMIPAEVAKEMIDGNDISEAIYGNFYEVMNICSKLFMKDTGGAHLRLDKTLSPEAGQEALAALAQSGKKLGFAIGIPRYGDGKLNFVVT